MASPVLYSFRQAGKRRDRGRCGATDTLLRLAVLNLAALILLWVLEYGVGERYWFTTLLLYPPQLPVALPTLLLAAVALAWRRWAALALCLAAGAVCAALLQVALPLSRPPVAGGIPLRVLTFNIWRGQAGVPGIVTAIRRAQPDVFCLQEALPAGGAPDPVPALRAAFPGWHFARRSEYVVASRFPIRAEREWPLGPGPGYRRMLEVELDVMGRSVTLFNVHFSTAILPESLLHHSGSLAGYLERTAAVRRAQAETLARHVASRPGPALIAGDFNSPPGSRYLGLLRPRFADSFAAAGCGLGYTYPARRPLLRIDYIFASREFAPRRAGPLSAGGSDHRAVVADLLLTAPPAAR